MRGLSRRGGAVHSAENGAAFAEKKNTGAILDRLHHFARINTTVCIAAGQQYNGVRRKIRASPSWSIETVELLKIGDFQQSNSSNTPIHPNKVM